MRILFVLSREVMFFHGSGEVEAKLLQVGIQLLGHECHIAGLDSGDFFDYDAYFLFSIRRDVIDLLAKVPQHKPCVIIPQVDTLDPTSAEDLEVIGKHLKSLILLARTQEEFERLSKCFPHRNCFLAEGWFLKPFIYEDVIFAEPTEETIDYCLCMVSADRDEGIENMAARCLLDDQEFHVVSDRPEEHQQLIFKFQNVALKKRVAYGSFEWYSRLENCSSLYEPNARLTCAVLEALWMGKKVFSPHSEYINSVLDAKLVFDSFASNELPKKTLCIKKIQQNIYKFHANFVAEKIINAFRMQIHA